MASSEGDPVDNALTLMRRLPPQKVDENLEHLVTLVPDEEDELVQRIDQPLSLHTDAKAQRPFVICDYNRDGDSYRSPWTNEYFPELAPEDREEAYRPPENLRQLEIAFNDVYDAYRELYFPGNSVSSVYLWDQDDGFAGCFLVKKDISEKGGAKYVDTGNWDSIHVIDVQDSAKEKGKKDITLTSTVLFRMTVSDDHVGNTDFGGSLTKSAKKTANGDDNDTLIEAIGKMIEAMEGTMRESLQELYIAKTREVMNKVRSLEKNPNASDDMVAALTKKLATRATAS